MSRRAARARRPTRRRPAAGRQRTAPPTPDALAPLRSGCPSAEALRRAARPAPARPGSRGRRRRCAGSRSGWRAQGTTADEIVRDEHQRQGATNVTVRNIITSMRLISDVDWAEFFESVSLVDEALRAGERLRRDGFRHAQPLPQRHRGARARHRRSPSWRSPRRRSQAAASARRRATATARSAIPATPDRRRPARASSAPSASGPSRPGLAATLQLHAGIAGYVGGDRLHGRGRSRSCRCSCWPQVGDQRLAAVRLLACSACLPAIDVARRAGQSRRHAAASARRSLPGLELARACRRTCARWSPCRRC